MVTEASSVVGSRDSPNLILTDKTQAAVMTSSEAQIRRKSLDAIDIQIAAAEAQANGETYIDAGQLNQSNRSRRKSSTECATSHSRPTDFHEKSLSGR